MNFDFSSLLGTGALLILVISVGGLIVSLLLLYLVVRTAVSHGLRAHQKWMEKNRHDHVGSHARTTTTTGPTKLPPASEFPGAQFPSSQQAAQSQFGTTQPSFGSAPQIPPLQQKF